MSRPSLDPDMLEDATDLEKTDYFTGLGLERVSILK